jgi:hypothetical protein
MAFRKARPVLIVTRGCRPLLGLSAAGRAGGRAAPRCAGLGAYGVLLLASACPKTVPTVLLLVVNDVWSERLGGFDVAGAVIGDRRGAADLSAGLAGCQEMLGQLLLLAGVRW